MTHKFYFCFVSMLFYTYISLLYSNPDAAQYMSFASIRCSLHRERIKSRPSIPDTLALLYNILQNSDIMQNIYKESITTIDGKTAIILSTDYLLKALSSATEIYVDGTFSVSMTARCNRKVLCKLFIKNFIKYFNSTPRYCNKAVEFNYNNYFTYLP